MSWGSQPLLILLLTGTLAGAAAFGQEPFATSNQPYIDRLKATMPEDKREEKYKAVQTSENPSPYIDAMKSKPATSRPRELPEAPSDQSYTDYLKKQLGPDPDSAESYIARERRRLLEAKDKEGADISAIDRVKSGNSELEMKRKGPIHYAAGFTMGTSVTRTVTATSGTALRPFNDVYGTGWIPALQLFAEFQPFHSEWVGNFGLIVGGGASVFKGTGAFSRPTLTYATEMGGGPVPSAVDVTFRFVSVPIFAGANFRLNLFRILRPYVQATPVFIPFRELRDDTANARGGFSKGLILTGGVSILLDWISKNSAWDLYSGVGVKHTYLTVNYTKLTTVSSAVGFDFNGVDAGFTFEF